MKHSVKNISVLLLFISLFSLITNINLFHFETNAINNNAESFSELTPKFSQLNIDINDSLIVSYEDINTSNYECSLITNGVSASIIGDSDYLQCEVEAIEGVEFGEITVGCWKKEVLK